MVDVAFHSPPLTDVQLFDVDFRIVGLPELITECLETGEAASREEEAPPPGGEGPGACGADSGGRAGDEDELSLKSIQRKPQSDSRVTRGFS